jgi:hypothetical protein
MGGTCFQGSQEEVFVCNLPVSSWSDVYSAFLQAMVKSSHLTCAGTPWGGGGGGGGKSAQGEVTPHLQIPSAKSHPHKRWDCRSLEDIGQDTKSTLHLSAECQCPGTPSLAESGGLPTPFYSPQQTRPLLLQLLPTWQVLPNRAGILKPHHESSW